jgi:hypothetical protein
MRQRSLVTVPPELGAKTTSTTMIVLAGGMAIIPGDGGAGNSINEACDKVRATAISLPQDRNMLVNLLRAVRMRPALKTRSDDHPDRVTQRRHTSYRGC